MSSSWCKKCVYGRRGGTVFMACQIKSQHSETSTGGWYSRAVSHIWFTACFFQICVTVQRRDVWWFEASSWFLLLVATSNSLSIVWVNYGAAQRRDTQQASNLCRYKVTTTLWTKTELQSLTTDTEICFVLFKGESLIQCAYDVVNPNIIQYSVCVLSSVWGDSKKGLWQSHPPFISTINFL